MDKKVLSEIVARLNGLCMKGNRPKGDTAWTAAITSSMSELGSSKNYVIARPAKWGWLYDLTWLDYGSDFDTRLLRRIPLVMESEWRPTEVDLRVDFNKLLFSRAELCLFIYSDWISSRALQGVKERTFDHQLGVLKASMEAAQSPDDVRILLACYEHEAEHFRYTYVEGRSKTFCLTGRGWSLRP